MPLMLVKSVRTLYSKRFMTQWSIINNNNSRDEECKVDTSDMLVARWNNVIGNIRMSSSIVRPTCAGTGIAYRDASNVQVEAYAMQQHVHVPPGWCNQLRCSYCPSHLSDGYQVIVAVGEHNIFLYQTY